MRKRAQPSPQTGIPDHEAYPDDPTLDAWEKSLRTGGRMVPADEGVNRLRARAEAAEAKVAALEARLKAIKWAKEGEPAPLEFSVPPGTFELESDGDRETDRRLKEVEAIHAARALIDKEGWPMPPGSVVSILLTDAERTEADAIASSFPTLSGRLDIYNSAFRLVNERHAKSDLIALVNWLLLRIDKAEARLLALDSKDCETFERLKERAERAERDAVEWEEIASGRKSMVSLAESQLAEEREAHAIAIKNCNEQVARAEAAEQWREQAGNTIRAAIGRCDYFDGERVVLMDLLNGLGFEKEAAE